MSEAQEPEQTAGCPQQLVWTLAYTTKVGIQTVWTWVQDFDLEGLFGALSDWSSHLFVAQFSLQIRESAHLNLVALRSNMPLRDVSGEHSA